MQNIQFINKYNWPKPNLNQIDSIILNLRTNTKQLLQIVQKTIGPSESKILQIDNI